MNDALHWWQVLLNDRATVGAGQSRDGDTDITIAGDGGAGTTAH